MKWHKRSDTCSRIDKHHAAELGIALPADYRDPLPRPSPWLPPQWRDRLLLIAAQQIPAMPDDRLAPLMTRFAELLAQHAVLRKVLGIL